MTCVTGSTIATPTQIIIDHLFGVPVDTGEGLIRIDRGVTTVILPIMSVYALVFLVLSQVQNTELSLVVEHVEVLILNVVVDQFGEDLLLAVSIGAELSVWALGNRVGPVCAKAFPVILRMILFFNRRMCIQTVVS